MNWKIFIAACTTLSVVFISIPQNIIGCGGSVDPYDYYISFFNQYTASKLQYKPFYYTNEEFLFDEEEPESQEAALVKEWVSFTNNKASEKDVQAFVMKFPARDISAVYYHVEKNTPAVLPDSISRNSMSRFFVQGKNLEALGYILYAKKVEPYVSDISSWEPERRDSIVMDGLLKNGLQLFKAAKTGLFKLRYAYQVIRLAHYNHHYADAIKYYDEMVAGNHTSSVLQPLCLGLKAGALFRLGNGKEAAYLFSKAFSQSHLKKVANYVSFDWALDPEADKRAYLSFCKNNEEKANMLGLFALRNPETDLQALQTIYSLAPSSDVFSTLVIREINKYEELYLTPLIGQEYGGEGIKGIGYYYYRYGDVSNVDSLDKANKAGLSELVGFLSSIAGNKSTGDPALMQVAAAYGAYMLRDLSKADEYLSKAEKLQLSPRLRDQWMLTNLLVNISSRQNIDASLEEKILPSVKWLHEKVNAYRRTDKERNYFYGSEEESQWYKFYRNLMVEILSKRYLTQGDFKKAVLCIGAPEAFMEDYRESAVAFLRAELSGNQAEDLYHFLSAKKFTPLEDFLVKHNSLTITDVADFAGTAYLRDYNYDKAIEWLQKTPGHNEMIEKDPFIDILYDREERLPGDKVTTSKLAYAKQMKRLHQLARSDKANAAKHLYKLALGHYNVTYYGYAWELVAYWRSGVDGYRIPKNATGFEKEYYGAYTAQAYFKKAMEAATDKNFKARCLFMMARCSQKQVPKPRYEDFFNNYDLYEVKTKDYYKIFATNTFFPKFSAEYNNTRFYKEMLTRCSYLSDFVAGN